MTVRATAFNELRNPGTPLLAALTFAEDAAADVGEALGEFELPLELTEFLAFV